MRSRRRRQRQEPLRRRRLDGVRSDCRLTGATQHGARCSRDLGTVVAGSVGEGLVRMRGRAGCGTVSRRRVKVCRTGGGGRRGESSRRSRGSRPNEERSEIAGALVSNGCTPSCNVAMFMLWSADTGMRCKSKPPVFLAQRGVYLYGDAACCPTTSASITSQTSEPIGAHQMAPTCVVDSRRTQNVDSSPLFVRTAAHLATSGQPAHPPWAKMAM